MESKRSKNGVKVEQNKGNRAHLLEDDVAARVPDEGVNVLKKERKNSVKRV